MVSIFVFILLNPMSISFLFLMVSFSLALQLSLSCVCVISILITCYHSSYPLYVYLIFPFFFFFWFVSFFFSLLFMILFYPPLPSNYINGRVRTYKKYLLQKHKCETPSDTLKVSLLNCISIISIIFFIPL